MGISPSEAQVEVAGLNIRYFRGGSGPVAIKLHHSTGNPGWMASDDALAEKFDLIVPDLPGYNQSDRPVWARSIRDISIIMKRFVEELELKNVTLIGCGLGGWVAAELATMYDAELSNLVISGAPGIKPNEGFIEDQIMMDWEEYVQLGFSSGENYLAVYGEDAAEVYKELWDYSREMTARLTWKPWMYNKSLEPLLQLVNIPSLVIWGADDRITPLTCGEQYSAALPNSSLQVIENAGHCVEQEETSKFVELVSEFIGR
jgi:pimeloyl-ACP methyl ester carboxylesterase